MRVVWVTQYLPEAHGTGAALHEFELIRQAARRHEVHVITAGLPPGETTLDLGEREVSAEGVGYRPSGPWILGEANRLTLTLGLALAWPTIVLRQERGWVRALAEALARYRKREPV